MYKPSLSFYTNIPTPYQLSFFKELSKRFELKVIYYAISESNREWTFTLQEDYKVILLEDNPVAKFIQRWKLDFHFSTKIFSIAWNDSSSYVIVGGSYATVNASIALLVNRFKGKKIAYFSESLFTVSNKFKYCLKWLYLRLLNICCDAIFCIGKKAADSFNKYHVSPKKFLVRYNIDEKVFQNLDGIKLGALEKEYKDSNQLIILSSGTLEHRKGMDILIRAVRNINCPCLRLIIIGNGPQKDELRMLAAEDKRIIFTGFRQVEELPYFFAIADMFALASRYDGWGVVINEAIAANIPIISSKNVGASLDLLDSGDTGILCESDNVFEFQKAIELLLFNPNQRKLIKQNALKLVPSISSSFNAELVLDIFEDQLNDIK